MHIITEHVLNFSIHQCFIQLIISPSQNQFSIFLTSIHIQVEHITFEMGKSILLRDPLSVQLTY